MTDQVGPPENIQANDDAKRHERAALEGEPGIPDVGQPPRVQVSRKAVVTVALLVLSLIAVSAISIQRLIGAKKSEDADSKRVSDRPAAASTEPKRLDLALPAASPTSAAPAAYRVPAIVPSDDEAAEPIAVRRTAPPTARDVKPALPEDAPAVLVSSRPMAAVSARGGTTGDAADASTAGTPLEQTRRTLEMYQRQLQGMLDTADHFKAGRRPPRMSTRRPPRRVACSGANYRGQPRRSSRLATSETAVSCCQRARHSRAR